MSELTHKHCVDGIKKKAQELIEQAYQRGYKAGYAECEEELAKEAIAEGEKEKWIKQGRNEAWEAVGKLVSMSYKECNEVLGDGVLTVETVDEIFVRCTASEAIEKLKAYEEQKQQEDELRVGDEVELNGVKVIVTNINGNYFNGVGNSGEVFSRRELKIWKKTNRTFPEIAQVLAKMKEGESE